MPASKSGRSSRPRGRTAQGEREVRKWLRYAKEDLDGAEVIARDQSAVPRHACFFAQQSAEKAIKAGLVFLRRDFPLRHDLDGLRNLLPDDWQVRKQSLRLGTLTQWAIEARYPGDYPDATVGDALEAVRLARAVYDFIQGDLEFRGFRVDEPPSRQ